MHTQAHSVFCLALCTGKLYHFSIHVQFARRQGVAVLYDREFVRDELGVSLVEMGDAGGEHEVHPCLTYSKLVVTDWKNGSILDDSQTIDRYHSCRERA